MAMVVHHISLSMTLALHLIPGRPSPSETKTRVAAPLWKLHSLLKNILRAPPWNWPCTPAANVAAVHSHIKALVAKWVFVLLHPGKSDCIKYAPHINTQDKIPVFQIPSLDRFTHSKGTEWNPFCSRLKCLYWNNDGKCEYHFYHRALNTCRCLLTSHNPTIPIEIIREIPDVYELYLTKESTKKFHCLRWPRHD